NPKVMIQAYRLLVERMALEEMHYPLHLGVTEAGDGEDGRIKGAIGIGSLLLDGLGDTIRVSLTEDSVYEIPVARAIAEKAMSLWEPSASGRASDLQTPRMTAREVFPASASQTPYVGQTDSIDPYHFSKRETATLALGPAIVVGPEHPPRVIVRVGAPENLAKLGPQLAVPSRQETPAEGLLIEIDSVAALAQLPVLTGTFYVLELAPAITLTDLKAGAAAALRPGTLLLREFA